MDIFEKFKNLGPLGKYNKEAFGYFMFPKLEGELGPRMKFMGKDMLVWSINNYLGLGNHPEVRETDTKAAQDWGLAYPMGARMMSGQTNYHEELERQLAEFEKKEAAYLLNYGYQGMVSIIESLVNRRDVIVYDSDAHACIIDGCRLHFGKRFVYPHNDMKNLEKELERATKMADQTGGGILVITEGVYGMSGNLGNLKDIVALKQKFDFRLLVDDAHGFGTMGKTGAGTSEHLGVMDKVDVYFGTFAKAMAGIGGFVASNNEVIEFLRYNMRSQIFAAIGAVELNISPGIGNRITDLIPGPFRQKYRERGNKRYPALSRETSGNSDHVGLSYSDLIETVGIGIPEQRCLG